MQQQLKGNRMKKKGKGPARPKSISESLDDYYKKTKAGLPKFAVYKMGEREGIARAKTIKDNPKAINRLRREKKKAQNKNAGGFLETFSPIYSVAKGRGPISDALSALGPVAGLSGLAAREQKKKREKQGAKKASKANMASGMQANMMPGADRMAGGGKVVMSKRTRSIDGIATRGKTRGTQR